MGQHIKFLNAENITDEKYFAELGLSYDTVFSEIRIPLLIGKPIEASAAPAEIKDSFFYEFISNQIDFSKTTKASASGKASFGTNKAKASASQKKFFSSNSYSCYLFGYIRLIHPKFHFDLRETILEPKFESFLKNNQKRGIDNVEKKVGDEVITSITVCSEILVKLEIQTYSEQQKDEIKASVSISGKMASGSASFSSVVSKLKSSKKVTISVYGDIPEQFIADTTPEEVDKLLLNFPKTSTKNTSILEFYSEPITNVSDLLDYNEIIDIVELNERKLFVKTINAYYEDLVDWQEDILYVGSNKDEFIDEIKKLAASDLNICIQHMEKMDALLLNAKGYWLKNGNNGDAFKLNLLSDALKEFPIYARIEPVPTQAPISERPKVKPARESGNRNDAHTH